MIEKHVYNTGKVKIGINYQKPLRVDMSRDMENLQRGLLSRAERRAIASFNLLIILALGAMVGLAIGWMV
jgi:hypothetical protein